MSILLADDDNDLRTLITDELSNAGYDVSPVVDGVEAVVMAAEQHFDLFLLDMLMPRMDGLSTIRVLNKLAPRTPIIAFTGYIGKGYMSQAALLGVICLSKPVTVEVLLKEVELALKGHSNRTNPSF
ncbi:MAG TPA: response regulator [Leptolinea sp.]